MGRYCCWTLTWFWLHVARGAKSFSPYLAVLHSPVFVPHGVKIAHASQDFLVFGRMRLVRSLPKNGISRVHWAARRVSFKFTTARKCPLGFRMDSAPFMASIESMRKTISGFELADKKILRAGTMQDKNPTSPATQQHRFYLDDS